MEIALKISNIGAILNSLLYKKYIFKMSNYLSHLKSLKMYSYDKAYRTASDLSVPKVTLSTRYF